MVVRHTIIGFCVAALTVLAPLTAWAQGRPNADTEIVNEPKKTLEFAQKHGDQVPLDTSFVDENGYEVTLQDCMMDGKPAIIVMAYYRCPLLCGEVFRGLCDCMRRMSGFTCGKDFTVITVSFDPKEKPGLALAKKRQFVAEYGRKEAHEGWKFLTGNKENIEKIAAAVGFEYEFDKSIKEYNHPSGIVLLSPEGTIAQYHAGVAYDPETIRLSLVEASRGQIGSKLDQLFLSCYRYNPHTGKYSADVRKIVKYAGAVTMFAIAAWLLLYFKPWKRSRKNESVNVVLKGVS